MHISAVEGQGVLQDASTNSKADVLLSASATSLTLMSSSSPLTLSSSRNIAPNSAYTKVVIKTYEDGIELTAVFFIILSFNIIYTIYYKIILLYNGQIFLLLWLIKRYRQIKNCCNDKRSNKTEVIEDVQAELDKSDNNILKRTFTFNRDTDVGKIQIGDRFHACVSSEDL